MDNIIKYINIELTELKADGAKPKTSNVRKLAWCDRTEFWMWRAAAVILIYPINKGMCKQLDPFRISDLLMSDKEDLVLKGYGWMLKVYGSKVPAKLKKHLSENVKKMPRVSFRYAIEKLDKETRRKLMEK